MILNYTAICFPGESISITIDGETQTIPADAPNFAELYKRVRAHASADQIKEVLTTVAVIKKFAEKAGFEIRHNEATEDIGAFFNGTELHSKLSKMLLEMFQAGHNFEPLRNFLVKALSNRDVTEVDTLYDFVIKNKLPITPDGDFLAFKATHSDGFDRYGRTIQYRIGEYLHVTNFDPDKRTQCGAGLHVGGRKYVKKYGVNGDAYWIVKVNPADTIFYRADVDDGKMRVSKLFVYAQCYGGSALDDFVPFMVTHSPEGDLLESAAKRGKKVKQKGGLTAKVATQAPKAKTKAERVAVTAAKKDQSFVTESVSGLKFTTKDGTVYSADTILAGIKEHGQRGYSAFTGIARSTLQGWVDVINGKVHRHAAWANLCRIPASAPSDELDEALEIEYIYTDAVAWRIKC